MSIIDEPLNFLPICMEPDGADPCLGFKEIYERYGLLKEELRKRDAVISAAIKVSDELQCVYYPSLGSLDEAISQLNDYKG